MVKSRKISKYVVKRIMQCFCIDRDATKTGIVLRLNRKTVNRYFTLLRRAIYMPQTQELKAFKGDSEMDKSY